MDTDKSDDYELKSDGPVKVSRPPIDIPNKDELDESVTHKNDSKEMEKRQFQDNGSQTVIEAHKTESGGFEDILSHLKEILDENSTVKEELMNLKSINQELIEKSSTKDPDVKRSFKEDFLLEENAFLRRQLKSQEQKMIKILSQVQKKFVELKLTEQAMSSNVFNSTTDSLSEQDLNSAMAKFKAELSKNFFLNLSSDDLWKKITSEKDQQKVTVINDDLQTSNVITVQEYNRLLKDLDHHQIQLDQLNKRNRVLEETLKLSTSQSEEYQRMASRNADEEISLRHLVVDLQSTGSEKQLIARTHRDLMIGK